MALRLYSRWCAGDGGGGVAVGLGHVVGGVLGGDVLEDDLQLGKIAAQRDELLLDEDGLAVKQVDVAAGHFAMHQQQHAGLLHGFQGLVGFAQVGHARIAVGGGTGGVELAGHHAGGLGAHDFFGRQVVGEVQRHQRLKAARLRARRPECAVCRPGPARPW